HDAVADGARACRAESAETLLAPFEPAAQAVTEWARAATTRLEALTNDSAVSAILAARSSGAANPPLPMPPPLFRTQHGVAVAEPHVPGAAGVGLAIGAASVLVWVPAAGDVVVSPAPWLSLDESPAVASQSGPIDGLAQRVASVAGTGGDRAAVGLIFDRD